jgi:predicted transcriptional regulator
MVAQGITFYLERYMASVTSIKLDDDMKGRIRHLAEARKRTSHWIMREAIAQYVEREEKREAFRLDTLKAWEEFRETRLHATAEEVDQWLESWGTDTELPAPECHK